MSAMPKPRIEKPAEAPAGPPAGPFAGLADDAASERLGLRARNKVDKLRRIKTSAFDLFNTKGFDDTTMREIARCAGVGLGTLFSYADNKRDLLFLVANDLLADIVERSAGKIGPQNGLMANLLHLFRLHYEAFAREPALSRLTLREMTFYTSGRHATRFQSTRVAILRNIAQILLMSEKAGEIALRDDADFVAWVMFCIFQTELRRWIASDDLDVEAGTQRLARALRLCEEGLAPAPAALLATGERQR
ncbi:MAG: TetR family transcriptional regulator [Hyphomicrobiales bacterium]|nr:TetR family transcriptional regulator [Hyphomicrobiales bacterium]